jgi:hypothetical protein
VTKCGICNREIRESPIVYAAMNTNREYCEDCFSLGLDKNMEAFDGKNTLALKVKIPAEVLVYRAKKHKECFSYTQYSNHATLLWQAVDQMAVINLTHSELWVSCIISCYPYNLKSCKAFEHFCKKFKIPFSDFLDGRDLEQNPLPQKQTEVTNGLPPTDKSVGIRPTTL